MQNAPRHPGATTSKLSTGTPVRLGGLKNLRKLQIFLGIISLSPLLWYCRMLVNWNISTISIRRGSNGFSTISSAVGSLGSRTNIKIKDPHGSRLWVHNYDSRAER